MQWNVWNYLSEKTIHMVLTNQKYRITKSIKNHNNRKHINNFHHIICDYSNYIKHFFWNNKKDTVSIMSFCYKCKFSWKFINKFSRNFTNKFCTRYSLTTTWFFFCPIWRIQKEFFCFFKLTINSRTSV